MSEQNVLPLNMNFHQRATVLGNEYHWQTSPANGVSRMPLEKEAEESGHTTSIVKFAPGSQFPPHQHPMGEEIYVLEGVFSDENGDYPKGSYLRNPPGSHHSPFTREGCSLFVKLEQFNHDDLAKVVILPEQQKWLAGHGNLSVLPLHEHDVQHTALVHWPEAENFTPHQHFGGEEILVISGEFCDEHGHYPAGSWLRSPHLSKHMPFVEIETLIMVKTGHLPLT